MKSLPSNLPAASIYLLALLSLTSCASSTAPQSLSSTSTSQPNPASSAASRPTTSSASTADREPLSQNPSSPPPARPTPATPSTENQGPVVTLSQKKLTGQVQFRNLSPAQLAEIRLIPENGNTPITPRNATYRGVDGLWWKPRTNHWLKIPDHCQAEISPLSNPQPNKSKAHQLDAWDSTHQRGLRITSSCDPTLGTLASFAGRISQTTWTPPRGTGSIGTPYPF